MDPVQFALQKKAVNDFFSFTNVNGELDVGGWIMIGLLIFLLLYCFYRLRKAIKKKSDKTQK